MTYTAYITRDDVEIEVTAEILDEGYAYVDSWADTGRSFEVEKEPDFYKYYAEYDNGEELILTRDEMMEAKRQMTNQYWDQY